MILVGGVGTMTMFSGCIDPGDSPTGKYLTHEEIKETKDTDGDVVLG